MPAIIKTAYGASASTGKANSAQGELSFAASNDTLWIGKGSNNQVAIGGSGKFTTLDTNQTITGTKTFNSTISGSISGNAGTATTLATARNINGTSFNGSAAITTATWGTARNITIGSTTRSVNGSAAYSWSLTDIGAAATSHSHGNITSAGAIGSTANLPLITTTSGVVTTGSFGTAANTFCVGNDSRLSNARTPVGTSLTSGQIYVGSNLNTAAAVALSGDATLSNSGALTIANNAITTAKISDSNVTLQKIQDIAGLSVLCNPTASTDAVDVITGSAQYQVLQIDSKGVLELAWNTIKTGSINDNAVTVEKIEDVAGRGILGRNATTTGNLSEISASAAGQFLQSTSTGLEWSGTVDGTSSTIKLNGNDSALPAIPINSDLEFTELYYIPNNNSLYGVRGNSTSGLGSSNLVLLTGGTDIVMYSDAAPEAEDTYLILSATKKMSLTRVRYLLGAGTCTDAKLKRKSGANTNDIVTFSVSTTEATTTSLNSTYKEIGVGDKLIFNPGTLSSGTTPEDLVIQIEYVAGSEGSN